MINENTNTEKKYDFVGDPIIDSGLLAIEVLTHKKMDVCSKEDLKNISEELVDLYTTSAWSKDLESIFPNSTYIQHAKNYNNKEKSKDFLNNLIDALDTKDTKSETERCIFCGRHAYIRKDKDGKRKPFIKTHIPLVGSSDFVNFFPSFKNGVDICARCALAVQFAPIVFYKTGGKPTCVSCNNKDVMNAFGKECIAYINQNKLLGAFKSKDVSGMFDEQYKSPENALFNLAYKVCTTYKTLGILRGTEEIVLYRIDNYNRNPKGVKIDKLPNNIFRFVGIVMSSPEFKKDWHDLLSKHYLYIKKDNKENPSQIEKVKPNRIHGRLLENKSILSFFKDDAAKKPEVPWVIVERYMELVRDMNKQRIETIKNLADKIAECIEETNNKRRVNDIISAKDLPTFRNQLRFVFKDWQKLGKEKSMISYDEYVSVIIPEEYSNWWEVRDLIVIRLYEKLHSLLANTDENDVELKGDEE